MSSERKDAPEPAPQPPAPQPDKPHLSATSEAFSLSPTTEHRGTHPLEGQHHESARRTVSMTEAELRAKIRALMASGDLPREVPSIERRGAEAGGFAAQNLSPRQCSVCLELDPQIALFYAAGRAVR